MRAGVALHHPRDVTNDACWHVTKQRHQLGFGVDPLHEALQAARAARDPHAVGRLEAHSAPALAALYDLVRAALALAPLAHAPDVCCVALLAQAIRAVLVRIGGQQATAGVVR